MDNKNLLKFIDDNEKNIISDLSGFVEIPSISSDLDSVGKALDYAIALGKRLGFKARSVLNNQVGIIEIGQGAETIGILSHVDVVEPANIDAWHTDPFKLVVKDGNLYGRGTMDDKGAIIASLYAMKAVAECGEPLKKKIQMVLGTQEEVDWVDMNQYVKEFPLPDYGFTPDGEFPLCNIEKGMVDIPMYFPFRDETKADGKYLTFIDAGKVTNGVPGVCTATVTSYKGGKVIDTTELKVDGKAVHSCQPEKGENAIFNMAKELATMGLQENQLLTLVNMIYDNLGSMYGKEIGLYSESEFYNGEFVHRNVFSPTMLKMDDDKVFINVNVRFAYGTSDKEIVEVFKCIARRYSGYLGKTDSMPAVYVSKDRPFMKAFGEAYEEATSRKHEFVLAFGGSYAKAMPNIVSWGPIFPDDEDTCHADNEYISIKSLMDNGRIFALALGKVALREEPFR